MFAAYACISIALHSYYSAGSGLIGSMLTTSFLTTLLFGSVLLCLADWDRFFDTKEPEPPHARLFGWSACVALCLCGSLALSFTAILAAIIAVTIVLGIWNLGFWSWVMLLGSVIALAAYARRVRTRRRKAAEAAAEAERLRQAAAEEAERRAARREEALEAFARFVTLMTFLTDLAEFLRVKHDIHVLIDVLNIDPSWVTEDGGVARRDRGALLPQVNRELSHRADSLATWQRLGWQSVASSLETILVERLPARLDEDAIRRYHAEMAEFACIIETLRRVGFFVRDDWRSYTKLRVR